MEYLCDEILFKIFNYCKDDSQSISLTNKRFYQLMCDLNKYRFPLKIKNYMLENEGTYSSIVNSQRIFNTMELDTFRIETLDLFWKLRTICYVKGANITKFTWTTVKMTSTEIVAILNLLPNLKHLYCLHWKLATQYYDDPEMMLNMPLETLSLKSCSDSTFVFFVRHLPDNVLKSLSKEAFCPTFLEKQKSLIDLKVKAEELGCEWIPLSLTQLELSLKKYKVDGLPILNSIIQQQLDLVSLDILNCGGIFDGDNDAFISICSLKNLKALKINIDDLSHAIFKEHFEKLNKIEELWIESVEHNYSSLVDVVEELSKTKLEQLHTLWIEVSHIGVPINRIERMGMNYPRLTKFHLCCELPLPLDIYLKNFKLLKSLEVNYHYGQEFSLICSNVDVLDAFFNINDINLRGFNFGSDINSNETSYLQLINALPNLSSLEIDINLPLSMRFLPRLLQKLPKLKILKGLNLVQKNDNYEKFGIDFVNSYLMISKKLEKLSLELKLKAIDMDVMLMKKMLSEKFVFNMSKSGYSSISITLSKKF